MKLYRYAFIIFWAFLLVLLSPVFSYAQTSPPPESVPGTSPSAPEISIWNIESRKNIIKLNVSSPVFDVILSNVEDNYTSQEIYIDYERAINHWLSISTLLFFPYSTSLIRTGGSVIPRVYFAHWWRASTSQVSAVDEDANAGTISGPYMGGVLGYTFYTGTYNDKDVTGSEINFGTNLGWQLIFNKGLNIDIFAYFTYDAHLSGDTIDKTAPPVAVFLGYAF